MNSAILDYIARHTEPAERKRLYSEMSKSFSAQEKDAAYGCASVCRTWMRLVSASETCGRLRQLFIAFCTASRPSKLDQMFSPNRQQILDEPGMDLLVRTLTCTKVYRALTNAEVDRMYWDNPEFLAGAANELFTLPHLLYLVTNAQSAQGLCPGITTGNENCSTQYELFKFNVSENKW